MPGNSLGALTVQLGLDASEYTRGLTRAEIQAQQFSRNVRSTILDVGKILGTLEIGRQVLESTKAIIGEASALNDLSDATGSSVEALSRLNNQAKIAGADFGTLQSAVLKLSAGMSGADEESTKAKEALRLLGVTTKDPVEALQQVAVKLNGYADGVNKVGIAVALFGKQGGQFLSTLKDIAELQDVNATITKRQAQEAEALEQAYRRLSVESEGFKNVILNSVVPALTDMISEMREGIRIAGGFGAALRLFGTLNPFDVPRDGIKKLSAEIDELEKQKPKVGLFGKGEIAELDGMIADRRKQIEFLKLQERNAIKIDPNDTNVRDQILLRKPPAPALPDTKTGKALREQTDEAQRYLESLLKQQQATLDLTTEETALVAIYDIEAKTRRKVSDEIKEQILDSARQIDQAKEAKKAADDLRRSQEEEARLRARNSEAVTRQIESAQREAQSIRDANEPMKEHLIFLRGGQEALDAYTTAKLLKAAAEKEDAAAMEENLDASSGLAKAFREQAAALKERAALLADTKAAEAFIESQKRLQDDLNRLFDDAGGALLDFVTGTKSAKDAFKDFARSIERDLSQMALAFLKNQLLNGGKGNSGSLFDVIGSLFGGGIFSGGGGSGGLGQFGGSGIGQLAAGTTYWRGGLTTIAENGPELIDLPAGARVTPKNYSSTGSAGGDVHVHQTIMPGADTRAHRQAALSAFNTAAGAARRR